MEVILRLEQRDAVLDRNGEQMLIVRTGRLELIEHDGEQHDHQCDHAADEPRELQPDGHSLSHKNPPRFLSTVTSLRVLTHCDTIYMRKYFALDGTTCQSLFLE